MDVVIDASWVAGLLLAFIRIAGFVIASPIFGRAIPATGRLALVTVLGFYFAAPVEGSLDLGMLIVAGAANAAVGIALGLLTGLIFALFSVAGGLIDFTSSLSAAQVFDPITQSQNPVFGRFFNLGALALFLVLGGDQLLVAGLNRSFDTVPLTGGVDLALGLAPMAVQTLTRLMIAAVELAMPALAALFITEVVLGIASRFAPQANVFLIGLPAKVLAALASVGAVVLLLPETMTGVLSIIDETFREALALLSK